MNAHNAPATVSPPAVGPLPRMRRWMFGCIAHLFHALLVGLCLNLCLQMIRVYRVGYADAVQTIERQCVHMSAALNRRVPHVYVRERHLMRQVRYRWHRALGVTPRFDRARVRRSWPSALPRHVMFSAQRERLLAHFDVPYAHRRTQRIPALAQVHTLMRTLHRAWHGLGLWMRLMHDVLLSLGMSFGLYLAAVSVGLCDGWCARARCRAEGGHTSSTRFHHGMRWWIRLPGFILVGYLMSVGVSVGVSISISGLACVLSTLAMTGACYAMPYWWGRYRQRP